MDDFIKQAKERYDKFLKQEEDLNKQLSEIRGKQRPYKAMLKEVGLLEVQRRNKKPPQQ